MISLLFCAHIVVPECPTLGFLPPSPLALAFADCRRRRPPYATMNLPPSGGSRSASSPLLTGVSTMAPMSALATILTFERAGPFVASDRENYDIGQSTTSMRRVHEMEALGCFPAGIGRAARSKTVPQPVGEVVV